MTRAVITHGPRRDATVAMPDVDMTTDLAGVELPSPVLTASGCAAAGRELDQFFDITALGAVVTKSIMLNPRSGRPTPRMAETPSGMLNSIGLQGPGIDAFVEKDLAWLSERGARAMVSIAGGSVEEYTDGIGEDIPLIVRSCVQMLTRFGLHHQGVFRVSGSQLEINSFREAFERGEFFLILIFLKKNLFRRRPARR